MERFALRTRDRRATCDVPACSRRPKTTPTTWATPSAPAWRSSRSSRCSGSFRWRSSAKPGHAAPSWRTKSRFVPEKYKNIYRHWMENIKDWCISRQLWWGPAHSRPGTCPKAVTWWPATADEALALAREPRRGDAALHAQPTCGRMRTCSTPGSRRGCGPSRYSTASATPNNKEIRILLPDQRSGDRVPTSSSSGWPV